MRALPLLLLFCAPLLLAQTVDEREAEEALRQQAFRDNMAAVVADLNNNSYEKLLQAMDRDDFLETAFGLRLIDQRMKRDFRERMGEPEQFAGFIESQYAEVAKDGIKASLLAVESRGDRGRAVVRFDMSHFQSNYYEYDLRLTESGELQILDWTDFLWGHKITDSIGLAMVQAQPSASAARKLADTSNLSQAQVFQLMEILKSTRDRNFERYFQIVEQLDDNMKRQRIVLKTGLDATRTARKRREQRRVLEAIDKYYPNDVLFALPLLDYYFPDRQYEKAYAALVRVRDHLGIDDAVTNARLSSTQLVLQRADEALALAEQATQQEPGLELGWWALLRAQVAKQDYAAGLQSLQHLQSAFGHKLGPDDLAKDPSLRGFVRSADYQGWLESQGD